MLEDTISVMPDNFSGCEGDSIHIEMALLRKECPYCGLWYGRDGSADAPVTTSFYYSAGDKRPAEANDEIKENSFQQSVRVRIPSAPDHVWIAARVNDTAYCKLQISPFRKEAVYLNSKIIRNRASGIDVIGNRVLRGGEAYFAKIGIEDTLGTTDFKDTILYLVAIPEPPPADWNVDSCLGIEGLPILVPSCRFAVERKYSPWRGQNPLDGAGL